MACSVKRVLPDLFLLEETTVRESGQSAATALDEHTDRSLLVTLRITHALEQETIDVDIYTSGDGKSWPDKPAVSFTKKSYCGTYQMALPRSDARFLKAVWRVSRWGRGNRPFFRFCLLVQAAHARTTAGMA